MPPPRAEAPVAAEASRFEWFDSAVQDEVPGGHHQHRKQAEIGGKQRDLHEFPYRNHVSSLEHTPRENRIMFDALPKAFRRNMGSMRGVCFVRCLFGGIVPRLQQYA